MESIPHLAWESNPDQCHAIVLLIPAANLCIHGEDEVVVVLRVKLDLFDGQPVHVILPQRNKILQYCCPMLEV